MMNPFTCTSDDLVHIVSGMEVPDNIANDVMKAEDRGESALSDFCEKRLVGDAKKLHEPIPKLKLKSFADVGLTAEKKGKGKQEIIKAERNLMARMVVIGSARGITIEDLMKYSLGPIPLSLAYPDGGLMKTDKAKLMHFLEDNVPSSSLEAISFRATWILDAMAVLQMIPQSEIPSTFGGLADLYLPKIAEQHKLAVIHIVPDRYPDVSIKGAERECRGKPEGQSKVVKIFSKEQKIPVQWKKFLACGQNKEQLPDFFFQCWSDSETMKSLNYQLVLGHADKCHSVQFDTAGSLFVRPVQELDCTHEEADTRLLLHASYASKTADTIVIQSPDTDVLVIAVSKAHEIEARILFETGCGDKRRTLDASAISQHLTESKAKALVGLHNFTGCDSVSAFHRIGKKKPMTMLIEDDGEKVTELFGKLGETFEVPDTILPGVEEFVSSLYLKKGVKVNDTRVTLYKTGKKLEDSIPPNLDCLKLHLAWANYQTAIQRRCLEQFPNVPSPDGHGWILKDEKLEINWMTLPSAPKAVQELTCCNCKKSHCVQGTCSCMKLKLKCTDLCGCMDCENIQLTPDLSPTEAEREGDSDTESEDENDQD